MKLRFDEPKATEIAAFILSLRGGTMHYLKLIKLLYLVDREALARWGAIVTTDNHVAMEYGPVGSTVLNLITKPDAPKAYWKKHISEPFGDDEVKLLEPVPFDRMSRAEEKLVREVYEKFGYQNRWDIVAFTHKLPEWKDPKGTSIPIHPRQILQAIGEDENEIKAAIKELRIVDAAEESVPSVR
jgi:uncharacterized phage-associated protein